MKELQQHSKQYPFGLPLVGAACVSIVTIIVYETGRCFIHPVAEKYDLEKVPGENGRNPAYAPLFSKELPVKGLSGDAGGGGVISGSSGSKWPDPPPHKEVAKVARYIMHISDWMSLATISIHNGTEGYPFTSIFSVSDGPLGNSTGVPYMYLTYLDLSAMNLEKDTRASIVMSEAQSSYCRREGFDPEDPRCSFVILSGHVLKLESGSPEAKFAKKALFTRHPEMSDWPSGHGWFFAKLDLTHIYVLDFFGGMIVVDIDDYFAASPF